MQEIPPPWIVFPGEHVFNQGAQEVYYREWYAFWLGLSKEEKELYILKWEASEEWKERLNSIDVYCEENAKQCEEWRERYLTNRINISKKNNPKKNIFSKIKSLFKF